MEELHKASILVVDDDHALRQRLVRAFEARGLYARGAGSADEALAQTEADAPELVTVDLKMPGQGGLELIPALQRIEPRVLIVVLTGYGSIATALEAVRLGALHYLQKPADADEILAAFRRDPGAPLVDPETPLEAPSLARAEWEHINRVLDDCAGNISEAARRLGVHRRSLQRKLQKYPPRK